MSLLMTLVIAVRALRRNAMRTALTALGMIIGVAAVIVMMALGSGARSTIEAQIRSVGSNLVTVNAGAGRFGPVRGGQGGSSTLTVGDAQAIRDQIAGVRHLTPGLNIRVQAISATGNWSTQAQGSNSELPAIRSWPTVQGSFFGEDDVKLASKVAVLGSVARDQLFGAGTDPVGQVIRIRNQPFRVVGVLSKKGQASFGGDQDDTIIVPYTTVQKRLTGQDFLREITIQADAGVDLRQMVESVEALLRERHGIPPGGDDDFLVRTLDEMAGVLTQTTDTMTYLLGRDCRRVAAGGRHRDHEHHAGLGDRAHARDRAAALGRRSRHRRAAAVSHRGHGAQPHGRRHRRRARLRVCADHDARDVVVHAGDGRCRPVVVWLCGGDRNLLRLLPGQEGSGAGPDRRAALRVAAG